MAKQLWKPGNMIYPLPAVMVSVTDGEGHDNIITVAWTGTVCTNPAMAYISVRPSRYSYDMIRKTGEFVINLTTEKLAFATDFCGVRSGRDVDKFQKLNLTKEKAQFVSAPMIGEAPVSIECRVREVKELGSHDMFLADVLAVHADEAYMDKNNRFRLNDAGLLVYSHGEYLAGGRQVGTFGYSVKKKQMQKKLDKKSDREADRESKKAGMSGKLKMSGKPGTSGKLKMSGKPGMSGKLKMSGKPRMSGKLKTSGKAGREKR
jgi:flavin reductase (DIM6/NTAB) family NADH-FMN oxidoreductase RutF